ncbi:VOC family protein [Rhizobium sp. KVB221]|uniref:VOC family protein n=1 Tax=Rhizobium setariae TaxID=2801340 RepID=A0A936YQB0_9HYPH|nr:VOC family protein [Rhizobium setariae]MBL0370602.1 VOC family protein [Rhizobium setariae]
MNQITVRSVSAYLAIKGAADAIEFYKKAFGAQEDFRLVDPVDGRIGHAELLLGGYRLYISDEYPDFGALSPDSLGGTTVKFHLDVDNVDLFIAHAVDCGALLLRQPKVEFHGYRTGMIVDPYGYSWFVATKVSDVGPDEMQRKWTSMASEHGFEPETA